MTPTACASSSASVLAAPRAALAALGFSAPRRVLVASVARAGASVCGNRAGPRRPVTSFAVNPGRRARLLVRPRVSDGDLAYSVTIALRSGRTLRALLEPVSRT